MASPQTSPFSARREELSRSQELYKQQLEDQVNVLKQDASKVGRVALLAGGVALATYLTVKAIRTRRRGKELQYDSAASYAMPQNAYGTAPVNNARIVTKKVSSPVAGLITRQLTLILGAVAKQMIMQAIERAKRNDTTVVTRTDPDRKSVV